MNQELPDVQARFRKGRATRDQIANIHWIIEKAKKFQKSIYLCFINYAKAFGYMDHNKLENSLSFFFWKFLNKWEYQITLIVSWETCMQVKKQ